MLAELEQNGYGTGYGNINKPCPWASPSDSLSLLPYKSLTPVL